MFDCKVGVINYLVCFIHFNLPTIQNDVLVGDSIEAFGEDPVFWSLNVIVVSDHEIFLSDNRIIGANNNIVVLSELSTDIFEVDFCKFSSYIIGVFVLEIGTESLIKVGLEVIHGEESFE